MSIKPNYQYIRNVCTFFGSNTNDEIDQTIAEFRERKIISDFILNKFIQGKFNPSIKARYGQFCYCADEEYRSYGSTLKPGVAYAMLHDPQSCASCGRLHMTFSNAMSGLWPSKDNGLTRFIKRQNRLAKFHEEWRKANASSS